MTSSRRSYILLLVLASLVISTALGLRSEPRPLHAAHGRRARHFAASFGFAIALQNLVWGIVSNRSWARSPTVTAHARSWSGTAFTFAAGLALMLFAGDIPRACRSRAS